MPHRLSFVALAYIALAAVLAQEERPVPAGTVELAVRAPDGKPLANADIDIRPDADYHPFKMPASVRAKTNAKGVASFAWPAGVSRLRISALGIGIGATGAFELLEKDVARPALAPLLPFGHIAAAVDVKLLVRGATMRLSAHSSGSERDTTVSDKGAFVLNDVPTGSWSLALMDGKKTLGYAGVHLAPGQRVTRVAFVKAEVPAEPGGGPPAKPFEFPDKNKESVWASGKVTDEVSPGIAGADVYAVVTYHGGMRMYEQIRHVRSDRTGRFTIKGETHPWGMSGSLLVHKPGYPPMFVPIKKYTDEKHTVILPSVSGTLEVTVLREGKPLGNASVQLTRAGGLGLYSRYYVGRARGEDRDKVAAILEPVARTDEAGVARFRHLMPGQYNVTACDGDEAAVRKVGERWNAPESGSWVISHGVAVRAGETRRLPVAIYAQPNTLRFGLLEPTGQPHVGTGGAFEWGRVGEGGSTTGLTLDTDGLGKTNVSTPGLWHVQLRYRTDPVRSIPVRQAPYFEGTGVAAVSPLLEKSKPPMWTARRHEPGSLTIQLHDADGKPAKGYVILDRDHSQYSFAGSTDEQGRITFAGMQPRAYTLDAFLTRYTLPDLAPATIADADLTGHLAFPRQKVTVALDAESKVVVRAVPVGYVRGSVRLPKGRSYADFLITRPDDKITTAALPEARYEAKTGEWIVGPLPTGKSAIEVQVKHRSLGWQDCLKQEVEVRSDKAMRLELSPPAEAKPQETPLAFAFRGGLREVLPAKIVLPDGKTPACAASVAVFVPEIWTPISNGETDALGQSHHREVGYTYSTSQPEKQPPGSPTTPVVIALLPGSHGATILPFALTPKQSAARLVLPPALHARGKVTIGGKAVKNHEGQLRILAAYQGKGKLNDLLSLSVDADAHGAFELAGLTPGVYQIQAALDGIWLSQTVRLQVKPNAKLPPLTLDIGGPGAASVVTFVDLLGKPKPGVRVRVKRPAGPLAEKLWPATFTADGAGVLHLPPLEVGKHELRVSGDDTPHRFDVPALADAENKRDEIRMIVK